MVHVEFIRGPLDGLEVTRASMPPALAHVVASGRCFKAPSRGRHPYHRERTYAVAGERHTVYAYAGHLFARCLGCGALHRQPDNGERLTRCTLCGRPLARLGVPRG